jgi:hypothetical protein
MRKYISWGGGGMLAYIKQTLVFLSIANIETQLLSNHKQKVFLPVMQH